MLSGTRVIVVGAGLAGLTAAVELTRLRASVQIVEARDRVGGRIWTRRGTDGETSVEAGAEFVDHEHAHVRRLIGQCGLGLARVLRQGFGLALSIGARVEVHRSQQVEWRTLTLKLAPVTRAYRKAGGGAWASVVGTALAARSVHAVLTAIGASRRTQALAQAMRGYYLAEPHDLSSVVLLDQILRGGNPGRARIYRIKGGAGRLPETLAESLSGAVLLRHVVGRISQTGTKVTCAVATPSGRLAALEADAVIVTAPAPLVRSIEFDPGLTTAQACAYETLTAGPATKLSLRFATPWWRRPLRPSAFGTNLPIGAVWEGAEDRPDVAMLTLLAGGDASARLKARVAADGAPGLMADLRWMGTPDPPYLAAPAVSWEHDPWSRGGYAVFGPGFDPRLRPVLGASHGRVIFAGEHTSERWQGFMNGAVESGLRAARDVEALVDLDRAGPIGEP
jgi:monoamine oxidase